MIEEEFYVKTPEDRFFCADDVFVKHNILVVHNPFAKNPISPEIFKDAIQLVNDGESIWWTDRHYIR